MQGKQISVTASLGVLTVKDRYNSAQPFLDADIMLQMAKACGRNNVIHEQFSFPKKSLVLQQAAC